MWAIRRCAARLLFALPGWVLHRLAGSPIRLDGQQLDAETRLLIRLAGADQQFGVQQSRRRMRASTAIAGGPRIEPVATSEPTIHTETGPLATRLYRPSGLADSSPLLVYYHGGGWVQGDLETHDNVCRFLALHAGIAVLSVDYRLAPEHPFPAAVDDALAAFRHVARHPEEFGADPGALAVGGDSAGGTLAVVVSRLAADDERSPVFQLLLYPGTDAVEVSRSRRLFGDGFLLTEPRIQWFLDQYLPDRSDRSDPRASPLREPQLHRLPPTYLMTAGFDPLRDEGEQLAARIAQAGVAVVLRRFDTLCHGFCNVVGLGRSGREAMLEIAGALRTGIALGSAHARRPSTAPDQDGPDQNGPAQNGQAGLVRPARARPAPA